VAGGELLAKGTPEEVAQKKGSYTGQFLKKMLNNTRLNVDNG
jgi:excinuclease ABC subunit A